MLFIWSQNPVTFASVGSNKVVIVKPQLVTFNCFPFDLDVKLLKCTWNFFSHVLANSDRHCCEENKNCPKAILTGLPRGHCLLRGGVGCTHSGHHITLSPTIAWHRISCESGTNSFEHCTLLEDFRNKKVEYHFKSGLYSNFSNSTFMNTKNQVGDYVSYCSLPCTLYESLNK